MYNKNSLWHGVNISPWPLIVSITGSITFCCFILLFLTKSLTILIFSLLTLYICIAKWTNDTNKEREEGEQSYIVKDSLKVAILLFIVSEVLFFFAWFWGFFHSSLRPSNELGNTWPPVGVEKINPYTLPLLNTIILLSRGVSVTWVHHCLFNSEKINAGISLTILLGIIFTMNQMLEYYECNFDISDSIFGSRFFITTGFHGFHVIVGTLLLSLSWIKCKIKYSPLRKHNIFEFSIWYWHFVDVVWLFLICFMYIWR